MTITTRVKQLKAFTLIELLVVIAIIALLIGILLPAIGKARDTARGIVCRSTMRDLNLSNQVYATSNNDYYSSPVNVGARYLGFTIVPGQGIVFGGEAIEGTTDSHNPTSSQDWITPLLADTVTLSPNRADRTAQLFNDYGCASATQFNVRPYNSAQPRPSDLDDFDRAMQFPGMRQVSYLMPSGFAHLGRYDPTADAYLEGLRGGDRAQFPNSMKSHPSAPRQPDGFRHRLDRVGRSTSSKIMFADGTRYYAGPQTGLDIDPSSTPEWYGSFTEPTPTYRDSTAYGRDYLGEDDTNLLLSFRHGDAINAAYFDGSVRSVSQAAAWTDPNPWHPTGTLWLDNDNTPESIQFMDEQQGERSEAIIH